MDRHDDEAALLPSPLTPFERYMLLDDRPGHPMVFFLRLRFRGRLDRAVLTAALRVALARHPLLTARLDSSRRRWIEASGEALRVETTGEQGFSFFAEMDLRRRPGVHLWMLESAIGCDLVLQFHHCCCDGVGAFQFIEDLLLAYGSGDPTPEATPRCRQAALLRPRSEIRLSAADLARQLPGLAGVLQFVSRRPAELATPASRPAERVSSYPASHRQRLDRQETAGLIAAAGRRGTVNDLLLHELFLALSSWRSPPFAPDAWLRIAVPIDLRSEDDHGLPAANRVSYAFIDRRPCELASGGDQLDAIRREMLLIKSRKLDRIFLQSLAVLALLPGALPRALSRETCRATCVLSNLRRPFAGSRLPREGSRIRVGDATLEALDFLPPIRPGTSMALAALTYRGALTIDLHYDAARHSAAAARDLLELFVYRLRRLVAPSSGVSPSGGVL